MKMLAEYLDTAMKFEQTAALEHDPKLKAEFEKAGRRLSKACGKTSYGIRP
jgi:hypothetical protein